MILRKSNLTEHFDAYFTKNGGHQQILEGGDLCLERPEQWEDEQRDDQDDDGQGDADF